MRKITKNREKSQIIIEISEYKVNYFSATALHPVPLKKARVAISGRAERDEDKVLMKVCKSKAFFED